MLKLKKLNGDHRSLFAFKGQLIVRSFDKRFTQLDIICGMRGRSAFGSIAIYFFFFYSNF